MIKKYIFRNEGILALKEIRFNTKTYEKRYDLAYLKVWQTFIKDLSEIIKSSVPEDTEIAVNDLKATEKEKKKLIGLQKIVTMDSYNIFPHVIKLGVSRTFARGGIKLIGIGNRPGYPTLSKQIQEIKKHIKDDPVVLIDDDVFSGGTIKNMAELLLKSGINVIDILVGVQISRPDTTEIPINAVYKYSPEEVYELNDPRDFLIGSYEGGLVIKLGKDLVRAPYIAPFVDVTKRASISEDKTIRFSKEILNANRKFYISVEKILKRPLLLSELGKYFQLFFKKEFGAKNNLSVNEVFDCMDQKLDSIPLSSLS